ncbi:carbohydrate kinase family protein [Candidatus Uhrbacteria bacterium]|nr:carbohydrate kinase family protein [Candidatus Uhrbacteria bacterium]
MRKKTAKTYDIISIGDTSLDVFLKVSDASLLCSLDKENCWFCLNYTEKVPVADIHFTPGGNACNNAVGSSRLGLRTALYTFLGDDDSGRRILSHIKKEGVASDYIRVEKNNPTNYSTVLVYKTDRTILVYHDPRPYNLPRLAPSTWIYLTSLGKGFGKIHDKLIAYLKKDGVKLAFNPGTHQLLAGRKALDPMLKLCDLLILNKEETQTVLGNHDGKMPMKDMLRNLHHLGPDTVVITDGANGAYGYDGAHSYRMPPMPAKIVERTGAGDAFSTGLLAALARGLHLQEALMWGSANSASVIEQIGPQAGLLTLEQMEKRCKSCARVCKKI